MYYIYIYIYIYICTYICICIYLNDNSIIPTTELCHELSGFFNNYFDKTVVTVQGSFTRDVRNTYFKNSLEAANGLKDFPLT